MIPKKVHFCWFGGADYSPLIKDCMLSWSEKLPDYQIVKWDETNSPMENPVVKRAIELKKWAFASDYVRLFALYQYGGIYLDTDMEIVRSLTPLLDNDGFLGFESEEHVNAAIIAGKPKMPFIKRAMDIMELRVERKEAFVAIPHILKEALGPLPSAGSTVEGVMLYPIHYFYPYNPYVNTRSQLMARDIKESTFSIHHWDSSWVKRTLSQKIVHKLQRMFIRE